MPRIVAGQQAKGHESVGFGAPDLQASWLVRFLLSVTTVEAIACISVRPVTQGDVDAAFQSVGITSVQDHGDVSSSGRVTVIRSPKSDESVRKTIAQLDLSDPDQVARLLRYASRITELYAAGREHRPERLVRLRNCLSDDGYTLEAAGDPIAAIGAVAAVASAALTNVSGIRLELTRLERALPSDVGAQVGRGKALVEATAKAVLALRGEAVNDKDELPALVSKASRALEVHVTQASGANSDQIKKILSRLHALTQDVAELRNKVGDGHGMTSAPTIEMPAGRLAARAAIAWCAFMLEVAASGSVGRSLPS